MPPEVARRVFEKFFTTRPEAGTGLGLACVHSAVRAAGGDVSVTSAVGVGTRFDLALPAVAAIASSPRELRAPLAALGQTILLAEDDELLRRWTARALRGFGYVVHEHEDGDTLLRELQTGEPVHVVIADAVTPRMGARALVESLGESMASALTHRDRPSVLVVSGHLADAPSWVSEAGARVGFLPKPYSMSELLAAIDALTSRLE